MIFTNDFKKSATEIISMYFEKDVIEKIFNCFKNWLDLQPVRHFEEGVQDSLDKMGRIRKTTIDFGAEGDY